MDFGRFRALAEISKIAVAILGALCFCFEASEGWVTRPNPQKGGFWEGRKMAIFGNLAILAKLAVAICVAYAYVLMVRRSLAEPWMLGSPES